MHEEDVYKGYILSQYLEIIRKHFLLFYNLAIVSSKTAISTWILKSEMILFA